MQKTAEETAIEDILSDGSLNVFERIEKARAWLWKNMKQINGELIQKCRKQISDLELEIGMD